jgi:hypothetical protein
MGVYKYTGKEGTVYFIDYYVNGKRYREQVGPKKKEAEEYLGKRLKEIRFDRGSGRRTANPARSWDTLFPR